MPPALVNVTAYALFTGAQKSVLDCLTVSVHDGTIKHRAALAGPAATYLKGFYGGTPRLFSFAPSRRRFFLMGSDGHGQSTSSEGSLPASAAPITLYAIDPATGASTAQVVGGAHGFVVSFAYHPESDALVVAVAAARGDRGAVAFYLVDPSEGAATLLGSVARGASEDVSAAFYCGYISSLALDPRTALRLGYQQVTTGQGPGLGVTSLPPLDRAAAAAAAAPPPFLASVTVNATTGWEPAPVAEGYGLPRSLSRLPGTDTFYGLAPSTGAGRFGAGGGSALSVVAWSRGGTSGDTDATATARVVLPLSNAHPPGVADLGGSLGYVADCAVAGQGHVGAYVALVVAKVNGGQGHGLRDRWSVVGLDLATEKGGQAPLGGDPWFDPLGAETVGLVGVGIRVG